MIKAVHMWTSGRFRVLRVRRRVRVRWRCLLSPLRSVLGSGYHIMSLIQVKLSLLKLLKEGVDRSICYLAQFSNVSHLKACQYSGWNDAWRPWTYIGC